MEWVRGGHWYPERHRSPDGSFDFASMDDGRRALLSPFVSWADRGDLIVPRFMPAPELTLHDWWAEVGGPAGLEPYDLTPGVANTVLVSFQTFLLCFPPGDPFDLFAAVPLEVDDALCELLEQWGPLEALPGVVPEPLTRDFESLRTVQLRGYESQLRALVAAHTAVERRVGNRSELSTQLADDAHAAFQDVEIYLRFESDRVAFDPQPRSLRAYLWRYVIGRWGRSPYRLCKRCHARFEVPDRPGKPPVYCEQHRNARSRKQAERLAPFTPRPAPEEQ